MKLEEMSGEEGDEAPIEQAGQARRRNKQKKGNEEGRRKGKGGV